MLKKPQKTLTEVNAVEDGEIVDYGQFTNLRQGSQRIHSLEELAIT